MVTVETSLTRIQESLIQELTITELEAILEQLGLEIDSLEGDELKIDVTAERPDLISTQGLARAINAFLGDTTKECFAQKSDYEVIITKDVAQVRPYTCCVVVKGLSLSQERLDEIIWVQEKLHATFGRHRRKAAIGIYPLENIEFPIIYTADKPENISFRPLDHPTIITAKELEQTATGKQYLPLLKDSPVYPYFLDAKKHVLSVPPIINSYDTGRVTEKTTAVFIECSGHDYNALSSTINILSYLFRDLGGELYSVKLSYLAEEKTSPHLNYEIRELTTKAIQEVIGIPLSSQECADLLKKMMYSIVEVKKDSVIIKTPPIRTDIWHDIDVIDDLIRAYGINNLEPTMPMPRTQASTLPETKRKKRLSELLIGQGFLETYTFILSSTKTQYENMLVQEQEHMKLGHSTEASLNMVRTWLLPELMSALKNNRNAQLPVKLFEVGEVVVPDKKADTCSRTEWKLALAVCDSQADLTIIKQATTNLLESLGLEHEYEQLVHESFIEGRCAQITINKKPVAILGEIKPEVLVNWGIKHPVVAAEFSLTKEF